MWTVLTKERFAPGTFNKLKVRKIGPLEVFEKMNANAYRLQLPADVRCSDVFNVKHLVPHVSHDAPEDSRPNLSLARVTCAAWISFLFSLGFGFPFPFIVIFTFMFISIQLYFLLL